MTRVANKYDQQQDLNKDIEDSTNYMSNSVVIAYDALDTLPVTPSVRFNPALLNNSPADWVPAGWSYDSLNSTASEVRTLPNGRKVLCNISKPNTAGLYGTVEYNTSSGLNNDAGFAGFIVASNKRPLAVNNNHPSDWSMGRTRHHLGYTGWVATQQIYQSARSDIAIGGGGNTIRRPVGFMTVWNTNPTTGLRTDTSDANLQAIYPTNTPAVTAFRYNKGTSQLRVYFLDGTTANQTTTIAWAVGAGTPITNFGFGQDSAINLHEAIFYNSELLDGEFLTIYNALRDYHVYEGGLTTGHLTFSPSLNKWIKGPSLDGDKDSILYEDSFQYMGNKVLKDDTILFTNFARTTGFDTLKSFYFIASAQTAPRGFTLPVVSTNDTIVTNTSSSVMTFKTLTSPAINTATINGGTFGTTTPLTCTFRDSLTTFEDDTTPAKKMVFQLNTIGSASAVKTLNIGNIGATGAANGIVVVAQSGGLSADIMINLPSTYQTGDYLQVGTTVGGSLQLVSVPNNYIYAYFDANVTASGTAGLNNNNAIVGTYTTTYSNLFTVGTTSTFTYTGAVTRTFEVIYTFTGTVVSNNRTLQFTAYKNPDNILNPTVGYVPGSRTTSIVSASISDTDTISNVFTVSLAQNDILRFYVVNTENGDAVTIYDGRVKIKSI